jgi:hypothetical protein
LAKNISKSANIAEQRSRAARIIDKKSIIAGSIVEMVHTCGKPGCRCASGEKHVSPYLAVRRKNKRTMISIPRDQEIEIRHAVSAYKELMELIDSLSTKTIDAFVAQKKRRI